MGVLKDVLDKLLKFTIKGSQLEHTLKMWGIVERVLSIKVLQKNGYPSAIPVYSKLLYSLS